MGNELLLDKVTKSGVHIGSGSLIVARSVVVSNGYVCLDKADPELP